MLDRRQRQRHQVGNVCQQIQPGDQCRAQSQRQRQVASWLLHLSGREGDVVPRIGGEERAGLCDAQTDEQPKRGGGAQAVDDVHLSARGPEVAEVGRDGFRIPAQDQPGADERDERARLGHGEDVLDDAAVLDAAGVGPGEQRNQRDGDQLCSRERQRVPGAQVDWGDQVVVLGNRGPEHAEEARKRHADRGNSAGLNDEEERPPVQKPPQRRERLAQVDVLATGARHHGGQFAVGQRSRQGEQPRDQPGRQQPGRAADQARDVGGDDEDPRADHRADHHHRRVKQPESAFELGVEHRGVGRRARGVCGHSGPFRLGFALAPGTIHGQEAVCSRSIWFRPSRWPASCSLSATASSGASRCSAGTTSRPRSSEACWSPRS